MPEEGSSHLPDEAGLKLGEVLQKLCDLELAVEDIPWKTVDLLGIRKTPTEMVYTRQESESFDLLGIGEPVPVGEDSDGRQLDVMSFIAPHPVEIGDLLGLTGDCLAEEESQDSERR